MKGTMRINLVLSLVMLFILGSFSLEARSRAWRRRRARRVIRQATRIKNEKRRFSRRSRINRHHWRRGNMFLRRARRRYALGRFNPAFRAARNARSSSIHERRPMQTRWRGSILANSSTRRWVQA